MRGSCPDCKKFARQDVVVILKRACLLGLAKDYDVSSADEDRVQR